MTAPTICEVTFPPDGWVTGAAPDGTATLDVDVTTDAAVPVELLEGETSLGTDTSDGEGLAEFDGEEFTVGPHTIHAVAGVDPDTTESDPVTITVLDMLSTIEKGADRSVNWYLNFLAGNTVYNVADGNNFSSVDAACLWAGVSPLTYTSLMAPLSIKAGLVNSWQWVDPETALNYLAYGTTDVYECTPWLGQQDALLKICQEV